MFEYVEDEHLYLWDGVIVPSVTQVITAVLGLGDIANAPAGVVEMKAAYGTEMHRLCEAYMNGDTVIPANPDMIDSFEQYKRIVAEKQIKPLYTETMVGYAHRVCGRFDLLADINGKKTLIDYKTTARYDADRLSIQLTMYAMAITETLGVKVDEMACIWLPKKRKAQYKPVPWYGTIQIDRILDEYEINFAEC